MNEESKSFTLRYYKHQRRFQRAKLQKKAKETISISESRLFAELEGQVTELQEGSLTCQNSCRCKVCTHANPGPQLREDHYLTNVEAYSCFFTLLQHLTMIQTYEAPKMLGQLFIPMLFFKKQNIYKKENKNVRGQQRNKNLQNQPPSFIVFKSNIRSGQLEYPQTIKSLEKVSKKIRSNEQTIRKMKTQQQKHILNIHYVPIQNQGELSNMVHKKFFNRQIPSLVLSSNRLIVKKPSIKQFFIHQEDRFINEEEDVHKMKQSQPFCIFRYTSKTSLGQVSKYQIFTIQTLQMGGRNHKMLDNLHKNEGQNLELIYIESYTRIKPQNFRDSNKHQKKESSIQVTYFSEYYDWDKSLEECIIFKLSKQQISIKSGKLTKIDPLYLDKQSLQQKISTTLNLSDKTSTQKIQKLVNYKTYKIIHILTYVCRIKVKSLKLKWMLNDHDQIVLLECLEYMVDRQKSLQPRKSKDEHAAHIVDNGLEYLRENFAIQDLGSMFRSHDNVNQMIQSKIDEKKRQKAKTEGAQQTDNHKKSINDLSHSVNLHKNGNKNLKLQPLAKNSNSLDIRKGISNSLIDYANEYSLIPMIQLAKKLQSKNKIKNNKKLYGSPARISYKLRPLKSESQSPVRDQ